MTFDGAGNATTNAKTSYTVNTGENASINVGSVKESESAPAYLTMNSGGKVTLMVLPIFTWQLTKILTLT